MLMMHVRPELRGTLQPFASDRQRGVEHQLTAKGIPASIVDQVLNSEEVELELAKGLLLQRAPAYQNLDRERRLRRAYSLLERRGFRWQTAHAAVTQVLDSDLQKD